MRSTIIIVGVKFNEDFIHLTMLMCQKWALYWVLVDLTRKHLCAREKKILKVSGPLTGQLNVLRTKDSAQSPGVFGWVIPGLYHGL